MGECPWEISKRGHKEQKRGVTGSKFVKLPLFVNCSGFMVIAKATKTNQPSAQTSR
jgi:hypothetical protein